MVLQFWQQPLLPTVNPKLIRMKGITVSSSGKVAISGSCGTIRGRDWLIFPLNPRAGFVHKKLKTHDKPAQAQDFREETRHCRDQVKWLTVKGS